MAVADRYDGNSAVRYSAPTWTHYASADPCYHRSSSCNPAGTFGERTYQAS